MIAPEPRTFALASPVSPAVLTALRTNVAAAVRDGVLSVVIELDELGTLDSGVISTLISILRDVRERGAEVRLHATRPGVVETLRITALDKVFTMAPATPPAPSFPARAIGRPVRARGKRSVAAIAGLAFAALSIVLGPGRAAAGDLSPLEIVDTVVAQNGGMHSYRAAVDIDVALHSFPYLTQHLHGTSYFERPDNFEIVFDSVPSYARGFDKLYTDIDSPSSWPARFDMSLAGEETVGDHRDLVLRLVQKVRGMIDHEDVWIDPSSWHVDQMEWHYYNGGTIAMSQAFENVDGFSVLAAQHATIRIPFVHAGADAVYADYRTNVTIDDAVFTRTKHQ